MIYSSNSIAVRHAYCRLGAGALAKRLSLVVRSPATAPRRSQDSQGTSSTSTCTHAPPVGRPPLSCAAVAGNDRSTSPDRTADGRKKRVRGAAANGKVAVVIKAPASFLEDGVLNVGRFLSRRLGLNWKVANGRFVKTNCRFLSYGKDRKTAKVAVNIYVTIDGRKRLVKRAVIWGKVRRATYAEFRMTGLKKALAAMGAVPNGPLELAGCSEDGRTLSVELQRVKAEQATNPAASRTAAPEPAAAQPAARKQRRVRVKKVAKPAAGMVQRKQRKQRKANKASRRGDKNNITIIYNNNGDIRVNEVNNWW